MINAKLLAVVSAAIMFSMTLGAGAYAADFGKSELTHFWVATPAGNVTKSMTMRGAGPPVTMAPQIINLDARGYLKHMIQPNVEGLSTHWIYNLGKRPYKIHMELVNLTIPVKWEVNSNYPYDPVNHTFTKPLPPGGSIPNLGIDWIFDLPADKMRTNNIPVGGLMIYNGGLMLTDADTHQLLTFIPIQLGRGISANTGGLVCC